MPAKVRDILARLKQDGWLLDRVKGSHHIYRHLLKRGTVTVSKAGWLAMKYIAVIERGESGWGPMYRIYPGA